jgi:hypothetical protein
MLQTLTGDVKALIFESQLTQIVLTEFLVIQLLVDGRVLVGKETGCRLGGSGILSPLNSNVFQRHYVLLRWQCNLSRGTKYSGGKVHHRLDLQENGDKTFRR